MFIHSNFIQKHKIGVLIMDYCLVTEYDKLKFRKGRKGVLHRLTPDESIYAVSKKYNVSLAKLYCYNPNLLESKSLFIPYDLLPFPKRTEVLDQDEYIEYGRER
jgi:hypothetical protein